MHEGPRLSDYALIGNGCAAALVSRYGSIDWCCLPEFHSPSIFAALLDRERGGYFSVSPAGENTSAQRYLPETNVAETCFTTSRGQVRMLDAFTAMREEDKLSSLFPDHEILRVVEGVSGTVEMRMDFSPAIFYGRSAPALNDRGKIGIHVLWKEHILVLLSTLDGGEIRMEDKGNRAVAEFSVSGGERVIFSLSYSAQSPAVLPELRQTALKRLDETIRYWRSWIGRCKYSGLYEDQVRRSALTLKLLSHAPSGAIIASPTTSLPEKIGGSRNWDYRYCWLRDASFTTRVLVKLGFEEEAHAYMNWILHATQLTRPELQVVYSVYGHARVEEKILDWLEGYRNSRPVRTGNKADRQFQLDVYGEVLDAFYTYSPLVSAFDRATRKFLIGLGEVICKAWNKPDNGIWEIRSSPVHHTHSKVMAWAGLDRLVRLGRQYRWNELSLQKFPETMALIRGEIERAGYNAGIQSYTRTLGGNEVDASLLVLPLVGYCRYDSPRMSSTVEMIRRSLSDHDLVFRYRDIDDGFDEDEGSFVACNFWLAENLARSGKPEEAVAVFETTLKHAGPSGLLSEQIDPGRHELVGNYPQGFSHIGLINAAAAISAASEAKHVAA